MHILSTCTVTRSCFNSSASSSEEFSETLEVRFQFAMPEFNSITISGTDRAISAQTIFFKTKVNSIFPEKRFRVSIQCEYFFFES